MRKGIFNFKLLQIPSKVAAHDNEFIFATDAKSFLIATPQVCIKPFATSLAYIFQLIYLIFA